MKSYSEYKSSGMEWAEVIPRHWTVSPLKYLAAVNREALPSSTDPQFQLRYIDIGNVSSTGNIAPPQEYHFGDAPSRARRVVRRHDTIISTVRTYLKAVAFIDTEDEDLIASTGFATLTPSDGLVPRYLYYLMTSQGVVDAVSARSVGVSYPAINSSDLADIPLPVPPKTEQQMMVDFLECKTAQIDTLVRKKQAVIALLREQRTSLINRAVTKGLDPNAPMKNSGIEWLGEVPEHWAVVKIKWLSPVSRGASPRPIADPRYFDENGEYAWVRISDVTASERYLTTTTQTLSEEGAARSVKMEPGSLFLSIAGSVGKPIITRIKCCIHDGFVYFPRLTIDPEFLYYIFLTGEPYKGLGKWGTQLNLNTDTVGDISVALPPAEDVERIVNYLNAKLDELDVLVEKEESTVQSLDELRASLISEVVTGKIDVRHAGAVESAEPVAAA